MAAIDNQQREDSDGAKAATLKGWLSAMNGYQQWLSTTVQGQ
jgi:hypothetical protein